MVLHRVLDRTQKIHIKIHIKIHKRISMHVESFFLFHQ
jgi:hypothetical protein